MPSERVLLASSAALFLVAISMLAELESSNCSYRINRDWGRSSPTADLALPPMKQSRSSWMTALALLLREPPHSSSIVLGAWPALASDTLSGWIHSVGLYLALSVGAGDSLAANADGGSTFAGTTTGGARSLPHDTHSTSSVPLSSTPSSPYSSPRIKASSYFRRRCASSDWCDANGRWRSFARCGVSLLIGLNVSATRPTTPSVPL